MSQLNSPPPPHGLFTMSLINLVVCLSLFYIASLCTVSIFVCLFCLSLYANIFVFFCLSLFYTVSLCHSLCLCLPVYASLCLSVFLFVYFSLCFPFCVFLFAYFSLCVTFYVFLSFVFPSVCFSLFLCCVCVWGEVSIPLYLPIFLCLSHSFFPFAIIRHQGSQIFSNQPWQCPRHQARRGSRGSGVQGGIMACIQGPWSYN
jgi:hypothetical protein